MPQYSMRSVFARYCGPRPKIGQGYMAGHARFEVGGKRLVQAMLFGHLGEVMWCLARITEIKSDNSVSIVEDMWSDLTARAPSTSARRWVQKLRGWSDAVKATLRTRLARSTAIEFVCK